MSDNEMNNMEEDIIVFEDEEGNEYNYSVVDYMFYNGDEYALLVEVSDEEPEGDQQECDYHQHYAHDANSDKEVEC